MRIGIDGIPLATPKTGIGHYTFELARSLARLVPEDECQLIAPVPLDLRAFVGMRAFCLGLDFAIQHTLISNRWSSSARSTGIRRVVDCNLPPASPCSDLRLYFSFEAISMRA